MDRTISDKDKCMCVFSKVKKCKDENGNIMLKCKKCKKIIFVADEEFNITYENLKEIKFYKMHVFKYSQRRGTRAAVMPNQIDGNIKEERSRKLIELSNKNEEEYNRSYIGKEVEVLFEEPHIENGKRYMKGHTTNYMVVKIETEEDLDNTIKKVKIVDVDKLELIGKCHF